MIKIAKVRLGPTVAQKRAKRENDDERAREFKPRTPILHFKPDSGDRLVTTVEDSTEFVQPPFKELRGRLIHLRQLVDMVLELELDQEKIDVRRTVIEDIDREGKVFVSQTTPPVLRSMIGKKIEMTFLIFVKDVPGGRWIRLGYKSQILDVIANYKLGPNYRETVIVVSGPKEFKTTTTRLSHRVEPTQDMDLELRLLPENTVVKLQDFSRSGLSFSHPNRLTFTRGSAVRLVLQTGPISLYLSAKVIRTIDIEKRLLMNTAVHFHDLKPETKAQVLQLATEMDRHILAMRSGVT